MITVNWNALTQSQQQEMLQRPVTNNATSCQQAVAQILTEVKNHQDSALIALTRQFDQANLTELRVSQQEIEAAQQAVSEDFIEAVNIAYQNIACFHQAQHGVTVQVETMPGVQCQLLSRPIESVGLYIPGGSAPLPSTVLMLAIPAKIAGCKKIVLCSPPPIAKEILYVAGRCGIDEIYNLGGAQAIAAMAMGTETVTKVDKIFGPGNSYVTEAKRQVAQMPNGAAIDMPAGPSEVLVIADEKANPDFIAADLLSQAEHGEDSQVVLVTTSSDIAKRVQQALKEQTPKLSRFAIAENALKSSMIIIANDLRQCVEISNQYGPEHLIIQTENAKELLMDVQHAGSVFLGNWSPESVGDYASGTNHVLPTYGYTRTYSSLSLADFSKRMTVQTLTQTGLANIARTVMTLAQAEGLDAHSNAVKIRLQHIEQGEH